MRSAILLLTFQVRVAVYFESLYCICRMLLDADLPTLLFLRTGLRLCLGEALLVHYENIVVLVEDFFFEIEKQFLIIELLLIVELLVKPRGHFELFCHFIIMF